MVGIRDLNTSSTYPFRYPKWELGMFYPAGSIVGYPKSGGDSDTVYYDFFVATRNVLSSETAIPSLNPKWEFFISTSGGSPDSDLKLKVYMMDSDLSYIKADYRVQDAILQAQIDSDLAALSGSVIKTVNGVGADNNGNVEVSIVSVNAGSNDQRNMFQAVEGDFWVVAGDSDVNNDGKSYIYDSDSLAWLRVNTADQQANDVRYINASGDTMIGALLLSSDPSSPLQAATKNYVDNLDSDQKVYIDNNLGQAVHDYLEADSDFDSIVSSIVHSYLANDSDIIRAIADNVSEADSEWILRQIPNDQIDSDWVLRQIPSDQVDSDWVLKQKFTTEVDSDWVLRQIPSDQVDSDWVLKQKFTTEVDSDWVLRQKFTTEVDSDWVLRQKFTTEVDSDWVLRQIVSQSLDSDFVNTQIAGSTIGQIDGGGASSVFSPFNTVIDGGGA